MSCGFDISGILIGNAQDEEAGTGCTVILALDGAVGAVDVRGGGPATRETDLLRPENSVQSVNAVMLSGGSAFGLDAATGVMSFLEEKGSGFPTGVCNVPIVCGASIFDLGIGSATVRPNANMGHAACKVAAPLSECAEGNIGAGTGATVGKFFGPDRAMKSGLGISGIQVGDLKVAAVSVVNAVGTIVDADGTPIAGVLSPDLEKVMAPSDVMEQLAGLAMSGAFGGSSGAGTSAEESGSIENTTISCVVSNAKLTKAQCTKVCAMYHDGYARAINPVHSSLDGDTVFMLATGEVEAPQDIVGALGANMVEQAIRNSVEKAQPAYGLKAVSSL